MGTMSYSNLRDNLAKVWDKVEDSHNRGCEAGAQYVYTL